MIKKTITAPPWLAVEPERAKAVDAHLPGALTELHQIIGASPSIDRLLMRSMLVEPRLWWKRKVRGDKRTGKKRLVWSPGNELREAQGIVAKALFPNFGQAVFPATAFGPGCSIILNAKFHQGSRSCVRMDMKDAFPSVKTEHIAAYLWRQGYGKDLAWVASRLLTFLGRLEQGAPVAPHLFNIMLRRMDEEMMRALPGMVYTRYSDDVVVSCALAQMPRHAQETMRCVLERHGMRVNAKKTRVLADGHVDVPGVFIKDGRIRPNGNYVQYVLNVFGALTWRQKEGHRQYVRSFGRSGRLRVFGTYRAYLAPRRPNPYGKAHGTGRTRAQRQP